MALVTGSSSGIGAAIAERLAEHGAHVALNSATSVAAGEQLAEALPGSAYFQGEVGDQAQAVRLVEQVVERFLHPAPVGSGAASRRRPCRLP